MEGSFTFEQLFDAYKSNYTNTRMTQDQNHNLRLLHEKRNKTEITLSQADEWMQQAGLIRKKVLTITDTGMIFSKFK